MSSALTLEQLRTAVSDGRIDTVLLALTDMQGRLQGKRLAAQQSREIAGYFWRRRPRPERR